MSDEIHASFWGHLEDLRKVLLRACLAIGAGLLAAFYFHGQVIDWIKQLVPEGALFLFSPIEGFLAVFRLSFWLGTLATSPYWIWGLIGFFKPALKNEEKAGLPLFILLSAFFIGSGLLFCLQCTLPLAIHYLYAFNGSLGLNAWGLAAFLDFALMLLFAHGLAFELGAVLLFLIHCQVVSSSFLASKRRHAVIMSLVIGALLTPPDVLTQVMIAIPLMTFYEIAIWYGKVISHEYALSRCGLSHPDASASLGQDH